ncbi:MAG: hypothetical protein AB1609_16330, partial [Bacillota bacterium]
MGEPFPGSVVTAALTPEGGKCEWARAMPGRTGRHPQEIVSNYRGPGARGAREALHCGARGRSVVSGCEIFCH